MSLLFKGPCLSIKPSKKPDDMDNSYWEARNKVSISMAQYVKWLNAEWVGQKTMSGSYSTNRDCGEGCDRTEVTAHTSTTKSWEGDYGYGAQTVSLLRRNRMMNTDDLNCGCKPVENFNNEPSRPSPHGQRPEADLVKMRYNVCLPSITTSVFLTKYNRTNERGSLACGDNFSPPTAEAFCAPNVRNVSGRRLSTPTCACGDSPGHCLWCSYDVRFCSEITLKVLGGWYDPKTKKVNPEIYIGGTYPLYDWIGSAGTRKDSDNKGPNGKHSTLTKFTIDGVVIPCGTQWSTYGDSGSISSTIQWTLKIRDL
jgi:hypothetical protein